MFSISSSTSSSSSVVLSSSVSLIVVVVGFCITAVVSGLLKGVAGLLDPLEVETMLSESSGTYLIQREYNKKFEYEGLY